MYFSIIWKMAESDPALCSGETGVRRKSETVRNCFFFRSLGDSNTADRVTPAVAGDGFYPYMCSACVCVSVFIGPPPMQHEFEHQVLAQHAPTQLSLLGEHSSL